MDGNRLVLLGLVGCLSGVVACGGSGLGEVQVLKGRANVTSGDKSTAVSKTKPVSVKCGDTVATEEGGHAVIHAGKQTYVLGEDSSVRIELASSTTDNGPRKIVLTKGSVAVRVPENEDTKHHKLVVAADACAVGSKGGAFHLEMKSGTTTVSCVSGNAEVFAANAEVVGGITADGKGVKNPKTVPAPQATVEAEKQYVLAGSAPGKAQPIPEDTLKTLQELVKK
jgi:hypothetical protein